MKNLEMLIKELKDFEELEAQLKETKEELKNEIIKMLSDHHIDEYSCTAGKVTYREVLSNRFASSEFKKLHYELYNAYVRTTTSMRFTLN